MYASVCDKRDQLFDDVTCVQRAQQLKLEVRLGRCFSSAPRKTCRFSKAAKVIFEFALKRFKAAKFAPMLTHSTRLLIVVQICNTYKTRTT